MQVRKTVAGAEVALNLDHRRRSRASEDDQPAIAIFFSSFCMGLCEIITSALTLKDEAQEAFNRRQSSHNSNPQLNSNYFAHLHHKCPFHEHVHSPNG